MIPQRIVAFGLAGLFGAAGYAGYRGQARQTATLRRIVALDSCLIANNQQRAQAATRLVTGMTNEVRKNRNQASDLAVLQQTQLIQARSNALADTLRQLRHDWPINYNNLRIKQLFSQLNQYAAFIGRYTPGTPPLTPFTQAVVADRLRAAGAMSPAALALLSSLETQVRQAAAEALQHQAEKVGAECICFDKIGARAIPVSETVAPNSIYEAQLVLAVATLGERLGFGVNGQAVPTDPATGHGLVQFYVPALRPGQSDTVRAQWRGRIQLARYPADTVLETTVPYFIVKPPATHALR